MERQIYVLIDPITLKVKYIGLTADGLKQRLALHVSKAKHNHYPNRPKDIWVRSLLLHNCKPIIRRICWVPDLTVGRQLERKMITKYRDRIFNVNETGINGKNAIITQAQKDAISKTLKAGYAAGTVGRPAEKLVHVYDSDGNYLTSFDSAAIGYKALGIAYSAFYKCTSGTTKQYKGYQFNLTKVDKMNKVKVIRGIDLSKRGLSL